MRIVSLLPSATEIVCELGLRASLVGVTHECDWPPSVIDLPKVTRTLIPHDASSREIDALVRERLSHQRALYSLDVPTLERLQPDLIVTQTLCDVCAVAEAEVAEAACRLPGRPRVLNLEPTRLADVLQSLRDVAQAAGVVEAGELAVARLQRRIDAVVEHSKQATQRPRVVLLEWLDPPFSCGHWTPELIAMAGGDEAIGRPGERSRTLEWDNVLAAQPEVLFIACCGFSIARTMQDLPELQARPGWAEMPAVRAGRVHVVDGNAFFSRPGPRLVESLEMIAHAMHPEFHGRPNGEIRRVG